jgi:hypothetical protein
MSEICSCTSQYKNSGQPNCVGALIQAARKIILVPRYANDGTANKITVPATLNQAYFDALINNADRSLRWYPLPKFVNVEMAKGESTYEEFSDKTKKLVAEGVRTFKGLLPAIQPQYLSVLKSGNCTDMAAYIVDKAGKLVGYSNGEENVLYPFPLNANTMNAVYMWATDTTGSNIDFSFEFDVDMRDEYIAQISGTDLTSVNLLNLEGLIDAKKSQTSTGQTSMVFKLYTEYGTVATPIAIEGLVAGDFALYNVTDSLAVTVLTATESPAGTYTLTYASQTVADVIRITPSTTGIDFTDVIAATATVA